MAIHIDAIYADGVLRPATPLDLPDRTQVQVAVFPVRTIPRDASLRSSSKLSVGEFRRIMREETVRVGSLSANSDRDDIYSDHD